MKQDSILKSPIRANAIGTEALDNRNLGMKQVSFSLQKLMHHRSIELEDHYLIIDKPDKFPHCFTIEFEVIAENLIDKVTGELQIIINEHDT